MFKAQSSLLTEVFFLPRASLKLESETSDINIKIGKLVLRASNAYTGQQVPLVYEYVWNSFARFWPMIG